jgi:hypothetical protein
MPVFLNNSMAVSEYRQKLQDRCAHSAPNYDGDDSERPARVTAERNALPRERTRPKGERTLTRAARISKRFPGLSTEIDSPFFGELRQRWPDAPTLAAPVSQICTTSQFNECDYQRVCGLMHVAPRLHRKQWEFVYIYRCIEAAGLIGAQRRGLAFGVGRERLPAVFIAGGCAILATDLPKGESDGHWVGGHQHTDTIDKLIYPRIAGRKKFNGRAAFRPVNMNAIPSDLSGFDFCWSACALEHLGSLEHGLDFIRNSLKCLKPGGVAAHTTEFNLGSDTVTLEKGPAVVYRQCDLLRFADEMRTQGHTIALNLHPGLEATDSRIDNDRASDIHLRLYASHRIPATSVGLCIRKAG